MQEYEYISAAKIKKRFDVSNQILRQWADAGKINCVRLPSGKRLYKSSDIESTFKSPSKPRIKVCYARVSSEKQKEDLDRQIQFLQNSFPHHQIFHDIGSGLNWKRKGFTSLLDKVYDKLIEEIVVSYRDRLCRFGFELIEWICEKSGTKIVVLNTPVCSELREGESHTSELAEDLLAITTVFVARNNGLRSASNRRNRRN